MTDRLTDAELTRLSDSRAADVLHELAVSMASYIAEIDASSADVADYIERRLDPLRRDTRCWQALERAKTLTVNAKRSK